MEERRELTSWEERQGLIEASHPLGHLLWLGLPQQLFTYKAALLLININYRSPHLLRWLLRLDLPLRHQAGKVGVGLLHPVHAPLHRRMQSTTHENNSHKQSMGKLVSNHPTISMDTHSCISPHTCLRACEMSAAQRWSCCRASALPIRIRADLYQAA